MVLNPLTYFSAEYDDPDLWLKRHKTRPYGVPWAKMPKAMPKMSDHHNADSNARLLIAHLGLDITIRENEEAEGEDYIFKEGGYLNAELYEDITDIKPKLQI